jgi:phage-related protein
VTGLVSGQSPIADFIAKALELYTSISPLGIIFEALQPIIPDLMTAFGELGSVLGDTLGTILPQLVPLAGLLAEALSQVFIALLPLLPPIVELASALIGLLVPILEPLIALLTAILPPITDLISGGLSIMTPILIILADALTLVADLLAVALTGAVKAFTQILQGDFKGALETVQDGWSKTWTLVSSFFAGVVDTIKSKLSGMVSFFTEMASNITMTMVRFKTGVQEAVNNVVSFFTALPGQVLGAIGGLLGSLADFGKNMITGLVGGISGMANSVINAVKRVIGDAISFAKKLLGIASPSKVFKKFGRFVTKGLAIGLGDTAPVQAAMKGLSGIVTGGFNPNLSISSSGSLAGYGAGYGVGNTYNLTVNTLTAGPETGRVIVEAISDFERVNGAR